MLKDDTRIFFHQLYNIIDEIKQADFEVIWNDFDNYVESQKLNYKIRLIKSHRELVDLKKSHSNIRWIFGYHKKIYYDTLDKLITFTPRPNITIAYDININFNTLKEATIISKYVDQYINSEITKEILKKKYVQFIKSFFIKKLAETTKNYDYSYNLYSILSGEGVVFNLDSIYIDNRDAIGAFDDLLSIENFKNDLLKSDYLINFIKESDYNTPYTYLLYKLNIIKLDSLNIKALYKLYNYTENSNQISREYFLKFTIDDIENIENINRDSNTYRELISLIELPGNILLSLDSQYDLYYYKNFINNFNNFKISTNTMEHFIKNYANITRELNYITDSVIYTDGVDVINSIISLLKENPEYSDELKFLFKNNNIFLDSNELEKYELKRITSDKNVFKKL